MLAVMYARFRFIIDCVQSLIDPSRTFHAGYIISILVGLALGEIIFGRFNIGATKSGH